MKSTTLSFARRMLVILIAIVTHPPTTIQDTYFNIFNHLGYTWFYSFAGMVARTHTLTSGIHKHIHRRPSCA